MPYSLLTEQDFEKTGVRSSGSHAGYIAKRKNDGQKFLLKFEDDQNVITEYIMGGVYKHVLNDSCPETIVVKSEKPNQFMIGSSWKENSKELCEIIKEKSSQNFEGIEEVIVTSLLCGEDDLNSASIIINDNKATRIDYEYSVNHLSEEEIYDCIRDKNFKIKSDIFKEVLSKVIETPIEELKSIISERVSHLQEVGINFNESSGSFMPCTNYINYIFRKKSNEVSTLSSQERFKQIKLTPKDVTNVYLDIVAYNLQQLKTFSDKINIFLSNNSKPLNENWLIFNEKDIKSIQLEGEVINTAERYANHYFMAIEVEKINIVEEINDSVSTLGISENF